MRSLRVIGCATRWRCGGVLRLRISRISDSRKASRCGSRRSVWPRLRSGLALTAIRPHALGLIDPATGHLRESVSIAGTPARVRVSGRRVWVTSDDARTASLIDSGTPSIARVAQIGEFPSDFAVGESAVWVID